MRSDFRDLGGYDQVGRGLKRLADGDRLVRIGYGLYARSATAPISRATVPQQPLPNARGRGTRPVEGENGTVNI